MHLNTGRWIEDELDRIIREAAKIADPGQCIAFISAYFHNTPYRESTLVGSEHQEEELVIDLSGMDCFTFLDYVEALRHSGSSTEFPEALKRVRYRHGLVSFTSRNHFFTDWADSDRNYVRDVTKELGPTITAAKTLNLKENGTLLLEGIEPRSRALSYLPAAALVGAWEQNLKTGDYAGIYSDSPGLDVSHVGIIIRDGASLFLRHASSSPDLRKIVDQDFIPYMKSKPGLIILRPV